jgi:hypothetical protein
LRARNASLAHTLSIRVTVATLAFGVSPRRQVTRGTSGTRGIFRVNFARVCAGACASVLGAHVFHIDILTSVTLGVLILGALILGLGRLWLRIQFIYRVVEGLFNGILNALQEFLPERHLHAWKKFWYLRQLNAIKNAQINVEIHGRTVPWLAGVPIAFTLRAASRNGSVPCIFARAILHLLTEFFHDRLGVDVVQHHLFNERPCAHNRVQGSGEHTEKRWPNNQTHQRITIDSILHVTRINIHIKVTAISDAVQARRKLKHCNPAMRRHHQWKLGLNSELDSVFVDSDQLMKRQRITAHQE